MNPPVPRIPLLAGTRLVIASAPDDAIVLRPPPPGEAIADVAAAVRDALRFPLAGAPLEALVTRGGRATIVVEPPNLPLPGAPGDWIVFEVEDTGIGMRPDQVADIVMALVLTTRTGWLIRTSML